MFFKAKAGDRTYTIERMTLGMWRELKTEFGVSMSDLDFGDPDVIIGMLYLAARSERPDASKDELLAEINDIDISEFETVDDAPEADPTPQAAAAGGRSRSKK